jgi:hypothetical protein
LLGALVLFLCLRFVLNRIKLSWLRGKHFSAYWQLSK